MRGFDAILFPEHTHMPLRQRPLAYPGNEERMVHYRRLYSPFVAMAWAAAATKTLRIGTCVSLPAQHDAIILAKTLASLDALSGGRIVYGFGWLDEEMIDHGVDPKRRRATVREKMLATKVLWTQEEASFSGEFVNFPPCWSWPKPPQLSRLPILLGARATDQVFDHVIDYCDGWLPTIHDELIANIARLRARAAEAGRDPATVRINVIGVERRPGLFEQCRDAGVERVIVHLPFGDIDQVRRALDEYADQYLVR